MLDDVHFATWDARKSSWFDLRPSAAQTPRCHKGNANSLRPLLSYRCCCCTADVGLLCTAVCKICGLWVFLTFRRIIRQCGLHWCISCSLRWPTQHVHIQKQGSWQPQSEDLEVRLLLYRGCQKVKELEGRCDTETAATDGAIKKQQ